MIAPAKVELRWFYLITLAFLAVSIFCLAKEMYWFAALPIVLGIVYLAVFSLDIILFIIAFATPLAIVINDKGSGPALSVPTEPLLFGVLLIFFLKVLMEGRFDRKVMSHPVTIAIILHLLWMFFTSLTSSMPLVSLKYFLSQTWFIVPFYFLGTQLFRRQQNIKRFVWLYVSSLLIVIGYTIIRHAEHGWTQKAAHWVMYPFYNDHTAYAAVLALFVPPMIAFWRNKSSGVRTRWLSFFVLCILITAIILSYTRAAWLSLLVTFAVFLVYYFRIKFYIVFLAAAAILTAFFAFQSDIFIKLERNRQDSATDFNKHIKSISNISTDASNLERINRWNSAMRMFNERPFLGWGPGTYQFNYAPFQKSSEMTIISTNAGDMGNAHSEYIGPLAEQGVFGMAAMILIVIMIIYRGSVLYARSTDKTVRTLTMGILLGLISYFTHGVLNNFLDTDKLAVPVWAFVAMIVSLDIYQNDESHSGLGNNGLLK